MASFEVRRWQDLSLSNRNLMQQFSQYFREGYFSQALALIINNDDIDSETVMPLCFNMIHTALEYLQNLYYNAVEVKLAEDEQLFQTMLNNYINKKEYQATQTYEMYNFVVYNKEIYMCLKQSSGNEPTDTEYWVLIGLKGEDGATSIDVQLKNVWDKNASYVINDVVTYENIMYVALKANSNVQPDITPSTWQVFMKFPRARVIVSEVMPSNELIETGGQWWRIKQEPQNLWEIITKDILSYKSLEPRNTASSSLKFNIGEHGDISFSGEFPESENFVSYYLIIGSSNTTEPTDEDKEVLKTFFKDFYLSANEYTYYKPMTSLNQEMLITSGDYSGQYCYQLQMQFVFGDNGEKGAQLQMGKPNVSSSIICQAGYFNEEDTQLLYNKPWGLLLALGIYKQNFNINQVFKPYLWHLTESLLPLP